MNITELMQRATHSLRVLCDHPGYLMFSGGHDFDDYLRVLREKIAGCTASPPKMRVSLMFLDEPERQEMYRHQVHPDAVDEQTWNRWLARETFGRQRDDGSEEEGRLPSFWARSARIIGSSAEELPASLSVDQFVERFLAANTAIRNQYLMGASVHDLRFRDAEDNPTARRNGPAVYFWLRDENDPREAEAVFVIVPLDSVEERPREQGFSTRDPELINALVGVFERYRLATTPGEKMLGSSL